MTSALLLGSLLLALGASPARPRSGSRLEVGQREFNRGDPQAALKVLDAAVPETTDPAALARVHLLRGQCFAALGNFGDAEHAFQEALDQDPEAALDPAKVDPSLVKMLDGLRARMTGELVVRVDRPDAQVKVDGAPFTAGAASSASAGRHQVTAATPDGRYAAKGEVVVRANKRAELSLRLVEDPDAVAARPMRPFADVRVQLDPLQLDASAAVGGGVEWPYYRVSLHARVVPDFGLIPRGGLQVPLNDKMTGFVELELPLLFLERPAFGLGGGAGVEFFPLTKWFGPFVELGGQHFFFAPNYFDRNRLTLQVGARLRLP